MSGDRAADLLGDFLATFASGRMSGADTRIAQFTGWQKALLVAACVAAYAIARVTLGLLGLPSVPGQSTLLLMGQPAYAVVAAVAAFVVLTVLAWPVVGRLQPDAPLVVAAIGLAALPVHGGDARNALFDAGAASVYLRMIVELLLLSAGVAAAYGVLGVLIAREAVPRDAAVVETPPDADTPADRLAAVGVQAFSVLALMGLIGQTPLKGQSVVGLAVAAYLAAWISFRTRAVDGGLWPVAGTLLAGVVAYAWSWFSPDGLAIGDVRHGLAGAAYALPLHYATAGVAGAIYGHWVARAGRPMATNDAPADAALRPGT